MHNICEKTIDRVIGNGNDEGCTEKVKNKYIIPNYQRGYRWTEAEVTDLLDDIKKAMEEGRKIYCLQPVVVIKKGDEKKNGFFYGNWADYREEVWEVVDGQQRLTTTYLILMYLLGTANTNDIYDICYESRDITNEKIINWKEDVLNYNPRNALFPSLAYSQGDGLDMYYLEKALNVIKLWFGDKTSNQKNDYNLYLRNNVFVLWYESTSTGSSSEAIDLFSNLNLGKLPLTASELLKALLLKNRPANNEGVSKEIQVKKAVEWDRIEHELSNESFYRFICAENESLESRMDYLFKLQYLRETGENTMPDKEVLFRYFEEKILNCQTTEEIDAIWDSIINLYYLLKEWYSDQKGYHKIGFLVACSQNKSAITVSKCLKAYENAIRKDVFFNSTLDDGIRTIVKGVLDGKEIKDLFYETDHDAIRVIILLFNVISAMNAPDYRFAFDKVFPLDKEASLEHIFPQTPKIRELQNFTDFKMCVHSELTRNGISGVSETGEINSDEDMDRWWRSIMASFGLDNEHIQCIGNIALISQKLNRDLSNKMFSGKQEVIREFDKDGEYIPLCTHNAFLKYYNIGHTTTNTTSQLLWTKEDINNHKDSIESILSLYLS